MSDPASQNPYMYCRGNPVKYSDPSGYDVYIQYDKELDQSNDYRIDWKAVEKTVGDAAGQPAHATSTLNHRKGKFTENGRTNTYVTIKMVNSNLGMFGSASGGNYAVELIGNSWENDFSYASGAYPDDANYAGFSKLATNKIAHEFWHALFGPGGHVADAANPLHTPPTVNFMRQILNYNQSQRKAIGERCR
jgi:hypothetical protein